MIVAQPEREVIIHYRFALATSDELFILHYLYHNYELNERLIYEIMCGAHVVLEDGGDAYRAWCDRIADKVARTSSHPSDNQQYAIRGALLTEFLFSTKEGKTWFQLENTPMKVGFILRHMLDFIKHVLSDKNIGPYGQSTYTHDNPLIIKIKPQTIAAA